MYVCMYVCMYVYMRVARKLGSSINFLKLFSLKCYISGSFLALLQRITKNIMPKNYTHHNYKSRQQNFVQLSKIIVDKHTKADGMAQHSQCASVKIVDGNGESFSHGALCYRDSLRARGAKVLVNFLQTDRLEQTVKHCIS